MPKLLFCDIDGTLVRSDGTISDYVRSLLEKLADAGHGFILTSGRPLSSILKVRDYIDIAFPHSYIIANNGGWCASVFSKLFKEIYHLSPQKYLIRFRLNKAKELLRSTGKRSSEISVEVGYKDAHYFSYL